jgi:hypothetical protein
MRYYELATKTALLLSLVVVGAAAAAAGSIPPSNDILRQVPAAVYVFGDSMGGARGMPLYSMEYP